MIRSGKKLSPTDARFTPEDLQALGCYRLLRVNLVPLVEGLEERATRCP